MPKATTNKSSDLVTITHEGKQVQVDLMKRCPPEMFKQLNVPWKSKQMYISATLVRDIIRARWGIQVMKETVLPPMLWTSNAIMQWEVTITVDGETFCGTGFDVVWLKKLTVAAMGQGWHVASLALKSALKKRFTFFEGDFSTAEAEGNVTESVDLDDIAKELSSPIEEPTPEVIEPTPEPVEVVPVHPVEVTPPVPVEAPVAPAVAQPAPIVEAPVAPIPDPVTWVTPLQALEQALHQSKSEWKNTLSDLQAIGKATLEKYNVEKGSDLHKALVTKAGELMWWFTSN